MENIQIGSSGPQLYLLSEEGYQGLKSIQTMLSLMAGIAYTEGVDNSDNTMLTISRAEIHFIFREMSDLIGASLEQLGKENWVGTQSWARQ